MSDRHDDVRAQAVDNWQAIVEMWEDLIYLSAFQVIHGNRNGYLRYRLLRFGIPETDPVPEHLDFSKPFPLPISMHPSEGTS